MANRENRPTVDIGAVEVALALSAVTAFMMQYHLQQSTMSLLGYALFGLEVLAFMVSGLAAMALSSRYVLDKIPDLTPREFFSILLLILREQVEMARAGYIMFLWAVILVEIVVSTWGLWIVFKLSLIMLHR